MIDLIILHFSYKLILFQEFIGKTKSKVTNVKKFFIILEKTNSIANRLQSQDFNLLNFTTFSRFSNQLFLTQFKNFDLPAIPAGKDQSIYNSRSNHKQCLLIFDKKFLCKTFWRYF